MFSEEAKGEPILPLPEIKNKSKGKYILYKEKETIHSSLT